jgi:N-acetylglucosaminyldiphosphoundecaprenol N-acetyl-beta-D-mannosaminyltransferase
MTNQLPVLGVRIDMPAFAEAVAAAETFIRSGERGYACHVDARLLLAARDDAAVAHALDGARFAFPDGIPLVWSGRMRGVAAERIYGPDFMHAMLDRPGFRHVLFGGDENTLAALRTRIAAEHPGAEIVLALAPPYGGWSDDESRAHRAALDAANADIIWVGIGAPRQELWMRENRPHLNAPLLVGVGAAFDFLSSVKPQAPRAIRAWGFEWLFRLASEPRRLWRRYLLTVPRAGFLLAYEVAAARLSSKRRNASR